jgi:hemolysin type calcium-binding protein
MQFVTRTIATALKGVPLAALALAFLLPTAASPESQIVIRGAESGSHLRLSTDGDRILVEGFMAAGEPVGCHFTHGRKGAVCPTANVSSIEVAMGPADDKVQVLDRLPLPLTTRLGGGSDKLIANSERDTCYPEGARRNRCITGGGNDVCITGNRNSDCVGGRGDDYCRHGRGSDGCFGGPGDDICVMGAGQDGCHGGRGNDRLYGGSDADQLYGGPGRDFCDGGPGWGYSHGCEAGPRR